MFRLAADSEYASLYDVERGAMRSRDLKRDEG
jgi:hypothetical protein